MNRSDLNEKENKNMQISEHNDMTIRTKTFAHKSKMSILRLALLSSLVAATPLFAAVGTATNDSEQMHAGHAPVPAKLVELVRGATRPFIDVNAATAAGYEPFLGCISGPDRGAMGVHYVKDAPLTTGDLEVSRPQALIYEPSGDAMRLVGVEYIVDAASWLKSHKNSTPVLEGQVFQLITSPNRYGLADFFELHVWAWRDSPNGAFVDWNTRVTCEGK
jgi:hypothetical protein